MGQYMLSVHGAENDEVPAPEEMEAAYQAVDLFNKQLQASGSWIFAGGLHPVDTASVISAHEGDVVVTDGPFMETNEHLGGFWIVSADDFDAALEIAELASQACRSPVEVRPFQDGPE